MAISGVGTLVHYPIPPHKQLAYGDTSFMPQPIAEELSSDVVSLPLWPGMDSQNDVISAVADSLN